MLQARVFSYADAHRHPLGTHYEALPVNAPRCPVHNDHKDGMMRFFQNDIRRSDAGRAAGDHRASVVHCDKAAPAFGAGIRRRWRNWRQARRPRN